MKGRQFRRRLSLQPSIMKGESSLETNANKVLRSQKSEDAETKEKEGENRATAASGNVQHKIVVMGAARVGKSSIISQFLYGTFSPKYKRTVEDLHNGDFHVHGVHLTLDILDTSGSLEFPSMRAIAISSADAFVLVYDITNESTFDVVAALRDQIHEKRCTTNVPIVVVGNKIDLAADRKVDTEVTKATVTVEWQNGFVETSAKDNFNVSQVFKELLAQAKIKYNLSPALRRRRRQSLPNGPGNSSSPHPSPSTAPMIPSVVQLQHLQQIRDRRGQRNSCIIS